MALLVGFLITDPLVLPGVVNLASMFAYFLFLYSTTSLLNSTIWSLLSTLISMNSAGFLGDPCWSYADKRSTSITLPSFRLSLD